MIKQGFNYVDSTIKKMTDFFDTRVENLEPKEEKKNFQQLPRNTGNPTRKGKGEDSYFSVIESSKELTKARRPNKKYCILHGKCSYSTDNCKDLRTMISKHKQKTKKNLETMERATKS